MSTITVNVEPVALGNLADGKADEQFQEAVGEYIRKIAEHYDHIDDGGVYSTKDGCIALDVQIAVRVLYSVDNHTTDVQVAVVAKQPQKRALRMPCRLHDGQILVDRDDDQPSLVKSTRPPGVPLTVTVTK